MFFKKQQNINYKELNLHYKRRPCTFTAFLDHI